MIKLLIIASLFCSSVSFAGVKYFYDKALPVGKGTQVKVLDYDSRLGGVFQLQSVNSPAEGYIYTRLPKLSKSIKTLDGRRAARSPASLIGKTFTLTSKLEAVLPPPNIVSDFPKPKTKKK